VDQNKMIALNEKFLRHQGSTDVLCFDYRESDEAKAACGEVFICVDEALIQSRRFRTSWQGELVRYLAHAALHLSGYDDHRRQDRRKMKQAEDLLLKQVAEQFRFSRIGSLRTSSKPRRLAKGH
jgi:probable rRNA maturation factor